MTLCICALTVSPHCPQHGKRAPEAKPYTTDAAGRTILDSDHPFRGAQPAPDNSQPGKYPGEKSAEPREWWIKNALAYETYTEGASYHVIEREAYDLLRNTAAANALIFDKCNAERKAYRLERDDARQDYADCYADLQAVAKDCDRYREGLDRIAYDTLDSFKCGEIARQTLLPKVGANRPGPKPKD